MALRGGYRSGKTQRSAVKKKEERTMDRKLVEQVAASGHFMGVGRCRWHCVGSVAVEPG